MVATNWYWTDPGAASIDSLAAWNSLADGSGSAPTNFGTGGTDIGADSTLFFMRGANGILNDLSPTNLTACSGMFFSSGFSGNIGNLSTGLDITISGAVIYGGSGSVAHFASGAAQGLTFKPPTVLTNSPVIKLSGGSPLVVVMSGLVHLAGTDPFQRVILVGDSRVEDDINTEIRNVEVYDRALFDSQNTPFDSTAGRGSLYMGGGTAVLRGNAGREAFIFSQSAGTVDYRANANIHTYKGAGGVFLTTNNPNNFSLGTAGAGAAEKFPSHTMDLRSPGSVITFPNGLVRFGEGMLEGGPILTLPGGTSGLLV